MNPESIEHALGRHEAHIDSMKAAQQAQAVDIATIKDDIHAIREMLAEAKGGWRTLMWVAGAAGATGAVLAKFIPTLFR